MSEQYLGEIRLMAFNFPPKGWAFCNGAILSIQQNQALFSLLGTTYGGNGQTTFALPDLRGRVPVHASGQFTLGQVGGTEQVTLTQNELPPHTHAAQAVPAQATTADPTNAVWAATAAPHYAAGAQSVMAASAVAPVGGTQPHPNMPPYLTVSFAISLQGIYPSRN
ncbi:phage tail protein [Cellulomonas alba]|uniref:Tail fiber protein n=1 Tax=Cellulomonas alba TaxID=3053467 RepID=A0ABT7SH65_9CELL|nr:tail fiber protein [Cellulomonas alba]MDM7855481.1 tail fiber protein [Cellulomonas alba]